jgi:hypothetical protein
MLEALESRKLFAVFNGTPGGDTIVAYVDANGLSHVVVNGVDQMTFDNQLDIFGHGGDDNIFIRGVHALALASVNPGEGSNRIYVGNGDYDTNIKGNIDILGHLGTDFVVVEDANDQANDFDYYEYTNFTFRKPSSTTATLSLFSVDEVIVNASHQSEGAKIISTSASSTLTWNGNGGNDTIYLGDGDLGLIKGPVYLQGNAGNDTVSLYDFQSTAPHTYEVFNTTVERAGLAHWEMLGSIENLTVTAGSADDVFNVRTESGSVTTSVFSGMGNDTFNLFTDGYISPNLQSPVHITADAGSDTINWNVASGQQPFTVKPFELNGPRLPTYFYNQTETINVNGGVSGANETYVVQGTRAGTHVVINAGDGSDTIALGGSFGLPLTLDDIDGTVTFNGGGGFDVVDLMDVDATLGQTWAIDATTIARTNVPTMNYGTVELVRINAGASTDTFNVNATPAGTQFVLNGNGALDHFNVIETAPGEDAIINGGAGLDFVNVNADGAGTANARFVSTQDLGSLDIGAGGSVIVEAGGDLALVTRALSIAGAGRLDLVDNSLIVDYAPSGSSPAADVRAWLIAGRNGGSWDGASGIVSSAAFTNPSTAIGYAEAWDLFNSNHGNFAGQTVDGTSVLLTFTMNGDADLDRQVNLNDFNRLAASFGSTSGEWSTGDFTYDGSVTLDDFNLLAANFGQGTSAPAAGSAPDRGQPDLLEPL